MSSPVGGNQGDKPQIAKEKGPKKSLLQVVKETVLGGTSGESSGAGPGPKSAEYAKKRAGELTQTEVGSIDSTSTTPLSGRSVPLSPEFEKGLDLFDEINRERITVKTSIWKDSEALLELIMKAQMREDGEAPPGIDMRALIEGGGEVPPELKSHESEIKELIQQINQKKEEYFNAEISKLRCKAVTWGICTVETWEKILGETLEIPSDFSKVDFKEHGKVVRDKAEIYLQDTIPKVNAFSELEAKDKFALLNARLGFIAEVASLLSREQKGKLLELLQKDKPQWDNLTSDGKVDRLKILSGMPGDLLKKYGFPPITYEVKESTTLEERFAGMKLFGNNYKELWNRLSMNGEEQINFRRNLDMLIEKTKTIPN